MAAAVADSDPAAPATSICVHCQREIPSSNIDLHSVHCARNLQKCQHCGEMVPRKLIDEHYDENHAPLIFMNISQSLLSLPSALQNSRLGPSNSGRHRLHASSLNQSSCHDCALSHCHRVTLFSSCEVVLLHFVPFHGRITMTSGSAPLISQPSPGRRMRKKKSEAHTRAVATSDWNECLESEAHDGSPEGGIGQITEGGGTSL
ncbi:hypothetical protein PR202_gb19915 [Eleusine coracana subsp. coracana]|uniref:Uncharacterized protein n=1 Tax=Eleusine coracana subsp. coracana TaxID=191504 RepID=A0AAV5FA43_ELECO|nr:hypothetical protein PR202_gb19915 [Eleusine coracana subsp. coracana]